VSAKDVQQARENWSLVCESCFHHISGRLAELNGVTRTHRDQTIAIMPVLSAQSPLAEYRKIADEILKQMPNERQEPLEYSLAVRAYLVFRVAVHLGIRQRNLRELLICPPGQKYRPASELEELRRGELRWNPDVMEWQVFIPALAFKNSRSTFFKEKPFHMALPNLQSLYKWINRYIRVDRPRLLKDAVDPETFFVRNVMETNRADPEFRGGSFFSMWSRMIQRYGIYNPYTGRGAIKGLLPHGPHCVRDVLATHILKQTGSYELASFAIQDSMETVMRHYARFLPHEKLARAAKVLNKVWSAPSR
jgi:hypothetical protein